MVKTQWTGGRLGTELMPSSITSTYYTEFFNEIPTTNVGEFGTNDHSGYHNGNPANNNTSRYPFRTGSGLGLICRINGTIVPTSIISASSGLFSIDSTATGYATIDYLPFDDSIYFDAAEQENYPVPVRARLSKSRREHIGEILAALNNICDIIRIPRRKYSIAPYTGSPKFYTYTTESSDGIDARTPISRSLFIEIGNHIETIVSYMINHAILNAPLSEINLPAYNYSTVNAYMIHRFRYEINVIEDAIIILQQPPSGVLYTP